MKSAEFRDVIREPLDFDPEILKLGEVSRHNLCQRLPVKASLGFRMDVALAQSGVPKFSQFHNRSATNRHFP